LKTEIILLSGDFDYLRKDIVDFDTSADNAVIVLRALYDENNSGVDKGLFRRGMIRIRANIEN